MTEKFKPTDMVKTCDYLERGIRFSIKGVSCCCAVTIESPVLATCEEMNSGIVNPEFIAKRRRRLFEAINGLNDDPLEGCKQCNLIKEKMYKDVNFDYLGGLAEVAAASAFNISHFSACNARCKYCYYTIANEFVEPKYNNIIEFIDAYRKEGKLLKPNAIDYNGGEPTILENFDEIMNYLIDNEIGQVTVYSNAIKYSQSLCDALRDNKCMLITSLDAGTPSTYKNVHGVDAFHKTLDTLVRYRKSGSDTIIIKYNICDNNRSDDDLYGFVLAMAALKPNNVFICPEFPYGDMVIPKETVEFGAKLYCALEKYTGLNPFIQTDAMKGDPKLVQYSSDIREEIEKIKSKKTSTSDICFNLNSMPYYYRPKDLVNECAQNCECAQEENKNYKVNFIQNIFSVKNEGKHKVVRILGVKIKNKRKQKEVAKV